MCEQCGAQGITTQEWLDRLQPTVDRAGWAVQAVGGDLGRAPFMTSRAT